MSQRVGTRDRATLRRRAAQALVILAALAMCWGGAARLGWHQSQPAPSSALKPHAPIPSQETREPILSYEPRELILSPEMRSPVLSPEARELVDSLTGSAAATREIRVGLFSAEGCCDQPELLARILEAIPSCTWEPVTAAEIQANRLGRFDVVIFPGGGGRRQGAALGDGGQRAVRDYVRAGGGYVGICAGAFLASAQSDWYLGLVNTGTLTGDRDIPGVGIRSMADRGPGTVKIELTDAGRAVFGDHAEPIEVAFAGGPIFVGPMRDDLPRFVPLAYYRSELVNYAPQRGTMIGTPSIVAAKFGIGRVIAISPHPESTRGLEYLVARSVRATARRAADANPPPAKSAASSATRREPVVSAVQGHAALPGANDRSDSTDPTNRSDRGRERP